MCIPLFVPLPSILSPMIGIRLIYKQFPTIALFVAFFLLGFLLLGSATTTSTYSSVYLVKLHYNSTTSHSDIGKKAVDNLVMRVNYMAMCASAKKDMVCSAATNVTDLESATGESLGANTVNLLTLAHTMTKVCQPYVLIISLVLVLLTAVFVVWQSLPIIPGKFVARRLATAFSGVTGLVWGLGAMLQHQAINGAVYYVKAATSGQVVVARGLRAEALSWTAFAFLVMQFLILLVWAVQDQRMVQAMNSKV